MKKNSILVALIGARMHYAVPTFLDKNSLLKFLYTDLYFNNSTINKIHKINPKIANKLSLRSNNEIEDKKIIPLSNFGLIYKIRKKLTKTFKLNLGVLWVWAGSNFNKKIISSLKRNNDLPEIIFGYNSASKELFQFAKENNIKTVLEQCSAPMIYENKIMSEEYLNFKDWEIDLFKNNLKSKKFIHREEEEWELADLIVVPSKYVKNALISSNVSESKIKIVPYGYNANLNNIKPNFIKKAKLNILFVGGLRLQKGIQYFYELSKKCSDQNFNFRAVGESYLNVNTIDHISKKLEIIGKVARDKMHEQYEWADILVVPSLSEGSATVIYESLSYGVPIICTKNSGSVIKDGEEGYIVEIRDVDTIIIKLKHLYNNQEKLTKLSENCLKTSLEYTVDNYGNKLISNIKNTFYKD